MDFGTIGGFALNAAKDMYSKGYNIKQYLGLEAPPKKTGVARVGQYFGDLKDAIRGRGVATHASTGLGSIGSMLGIQGRKLSFGERAKSYLKNVGTAITGRTEHANQSPYAFVGGILNKFSGKQEVMNKIRSDNKNGQKTKNNQNNQVNNSSQQSSNNTQPAQSSQSSSQSAQTNNSNNAGAPTAPPAPSGSNQPSSPAPPAGNSSDGGGVNNSLDTTLDAVKNNDPNANKMVGDWIQKSNEEHNAVMKQVDEIMNRK